jgi:hypothetical protein
MTKTALQPRKTTAKKLSFSNFGGTKQATYKKRDSADLVGRFCPSKGPFRAKIPTRIEKCSFL